MNPALAGVALAITVGAIIAVSAHDARIGVLGLAAVMIGAPILADPIADTAGLAARAVAGVLAVYLLMIAVRGDEAPTGGSRLGWAAEASVAAAAAIVGFAVHGLGAVGLGPALAQGAGFALAALAIVPLITGRDVVRIGVGLLLLTHGSLLVRVGLGGTPSTLEELATAGLVVGLAGVIGVLAFSAKRDGVGGFGLAIGPRIRAQGRPDHSERRRPRPADSVPLWSSDSFPSERP
jgi:hypothetical protein